MRFLDLAVAGLIGVSAISVIAVATPQSGDDASATYAMRVRLRDAIVSQLDHRGIHWFLAYSSGLVCSGLALASNSTITLSAKTGSFSCGSPPPRTISENLTLQTNPPVELMAWSATGE